MSRLSSGTIFTSPGDNHQYKVLTTNTTVSLWELSGGGVGDVIIDSVVYDSAGYDYTVVYVGQNSSTQNVTAPSSSLTSITLPLSVLTLGVNCFGTSSSTSSTAAKQLVSITAPGVTSVSSGAFQYCSALKYVNLPSLQTTGAYPFQGTNVEYLYFPNLTSIGPLTFNSTPLKGLYINKSKSEVTISTTLPGVFYDTPSECTIYYEPSKTWPATYTDRNREIPCVAYNPSITLESSVPSPNHGTNVTLTATFSPTGLGVSYIFYRNGLVLGTGAQSTNTYDITSISSADNGIYTVEAQSVFGFTASSSGVSITVISVSPPVITTQPTSGYMIAEVSTYTLSVVATGADSYQWYTGTDAPISGATSSTYTVVQLTEATLSFYVIVSNAAGSTRSNTVTVDVNKYGAPISITPDNFERLNFSTTTSTPIKSSNRNYSAKAAIPTGGSATVGGGTVGGTQTPPITYSNMPSSITFVQSAVTPPMRNFTSGKMELYINTVMKDSAGKVISDFSAIGGITISFPCPPSLLDGNSLASFQLYEINDNTNLPTLIPTSNITYDSTTGLLSATVQHFSEKKFENSSRNVVCFPAGERVLTTDGFRTVEDLRRGDCLVTSDGRSVPAVVYRMSVPYATEKTAPYLIPAHTFRHNSPPADIRLSPHHAFQIGKGLWHLPVAAARTHSSIRQYGVGEPITYYHIELPNYFTDNIVMEGGTVVESYAAKQVPRGTRVYTYSASRDAYTRQPSPKGAVRCSM